MKHLLFTVMLLWALRPVSAQDRLSAVVVDSDNQPLPGVTVAGDRPGTGAVTDERGRFELPLDPPVNRLTFSSVGFQTIQFLVRELPDTIRLEPRFYRGEDILVRSERVERGLGTIAFENFSEEEIARDYAVGEFPLLLATTPNLHSFSDGGTPLGYSYMRIRGFDDKRIATYINGVPLNDPEDQSTYFVDLPDFAATIEDIQVQRGVGNSLYGDGSFGGAINVVTTGLDRPRGATISSLYGEYTHDGQRHSDIYKQSLEYSTGLIDNRWLFTGRYSTQRTGGYRDNSWYEGWAYYFSVARLDPKMTTELHVYGGPIRMHLAYFGATKEAIAANRLANVLDYDNETDNFNQPHYHLHHTYRISANASLQNTLYYIRGKGYYEQYGFEQALADYNIPAEVVSIDTLTGLPHQTGDLVRQHHVEKNQWGWNPRLDIDHERGRHSLGGSLYYFKSHHWGQVVWSQHLAGGLDPRQRFYEYDGTKLVGSVYAQERYRLTDRLTTQVTAQLRFQRYDFEQARMGAFLGHHYDVSWVFFSPRLGFNYQLQPNLNLYTNLAVAKRTPTDFSIYNALDPHALPSLEIERNWGDTLYQFGDPTASEETIYDFSLGMQYRSNRWAAGIDLFWMDFRDEIIPYGGVDQQTGISRTVNADRSVHAGVELSGKVRLTEALTFDGNFSWNYNRIKEYIGDLIVYAPDTAYVVAADYGDKTIPLFPEYIANGIFDYKTDRWRLTYTLRLLGEQFAELDNLDSLAIAAYTTSSLALAHTIPGLFGLGDVTLRVQVDNIFDEEYLTSGYGWSYGLSDGVGQPVSVVREAEYFVGPERSYFGQVVIALF